MVHNPITYMFKISKPTNIPIASPIIFKNFDIIIKKEMEDLLTMPRIYVWSPPPSRPHICSYFWIWFWIIDGIANC